MDICAILRYNDASLKKNKKYGGIITCPMKSN